MSTLGIEQDLADGYAYVYSHPSLPTTISVGHLPGRKLPCLYAVEGPVVRTLARFVSVREAAQFVETLGKMIALSGGIRG